MACSVAYSFPVRPLSQGATVATTLNGEDRWTDLLSRRLHAVYGNKVAVVNAGIGGNQVVGPLEYTAHHGDDCCRAEVKKRFEVKPIEVP